MTFNRAIGSILKPVRLLSSVGMTLNYKSMLYFQFSHTIQSYSFLYDYTCTHNYISVSRKYLKGQKGSYFQ